MRAPSGYLTRDYIIDKYIAKNLQICGLTMKISSRGHRHLIYIVKGNSKTEGMGPFKC